MSTEMKAKLAGQLRHIAGTFGAFGAGAATTATGALPESVPATSLEFVIGSLLLSVLAHAASWVVKRT